MPIVPKYAPEVLPQAPDRLQPTNWESLIPGVRAQGEREAREAMAMAVLGALATDGVSITLPQITGRQETSEVVGWTQASP